QMVLRTMRGMSAYPEVVTSPATIARPVLTSVSTATRPCLSWAMIASTTPSEIWSAILSGCPSVTDSEVNRYSLSESVVMESGGSAPRSNRPPRSPRSGNRVNPLKVGQERPKAQPARDARLLAEAEELAEVEKG